MSVYRQSNVQPKAKPEVLCGSERVFEMTKKLGYTHRVDWLSASEEQRKALYRVTRAIADATGTDVLDIIAQAEGTKNERGLGYVTNFNHGRIGRKVAKQIAQWIERHHRELAHEKEPEIFPISLATIWSEHLEAHGIAGRLHIRPKSNARDLVEFEAEATPGHHVLALGEPFALEIEPTRGGYCIGYQIYREKWYPFPLSKERFWIRADGGKITVPQTQDGSPAHIIERQHSDLHRFVVVISDQVQTELISKKPAAYDGSTFEMHYVSVEFRENG